MINSLGGVSTKVVSACNMDRNVVESGWRSWQWGWCQGSSLTVGGARAATWLWHFHIETLIEH